jgi:integrase/recombinase XerD
VEYAVAVERFLSTAALGAGSRRVYRIALTTWAWAVVDRTPPVGTGRRHAAPPAFPLALLDTSRAAARLQEAFALRSAAVGARTVNRELSILAGALDWWRTQGWLTGDPVAGLRRLPVPPRPGTQLGLDAGQARAVLQLPAALREQALWHLLYESCGTIERVLALDVDDLDVPARRVRERNGPPLRWGEGTARLLPLLTLGRVNGPLFLTRRGRLSYRRAAEMFTAATSPLDPRGRGWTLRQLVAAGGHQTPAARPDLAAQPRGQAFRIR